MTSFGTQGCSSVPLAVLEVEAIDFLLLLVNDDYFENSNKMSTYVHRNLFTDHGSYLGNSLPSSGTSYCRNHFPEYL